MNDFRSSWWLWQTDPQRPRARACSAFYVASGIWKTALVPLLVAGTISIVWALYSPNAMRPNHPGTVQLQKALFVGLYAASLLIVVVGLAVVFALVARWRVWVHPSLHRSRQRDIWPPSFAPGDEMQGNQARLIVVTGVFALVLIGPVVSLSLLSHLVIPLPARPLIALAVIFGYPMFAVTALAALRTRLFAESPWECWPESIRQLSEGDRHVVDSHGKEAVEPT